MRDADADKCGRSKRVRAAAGPGRDFQKRSNVHQRRAVLARGLLSRDVPGAVRGLV